MLDSTSLYIVLYNDVANKVLFKILLLLLLPLSIFLYSSFITTTGTSGISSLIPIVILFTLSTPSIISVLFSVIVPLLFKTD